MEVHELLEAADRLTVRALSVRLARIACDLDEAAQAVADLPLRPADLLLLAAPALHLSISVERLDHDLRELERYGQSPPVETLARAA